MCPKDLPLSFLILHISASNRYLIEISHAEQMYSIIKTGLNFTMSVKSNIG
jgi:hypothetical protein